MSLALKGKVAIVTGASKGIGAAIAKAYAEAGAAVVVNYDSDREGAQRVVADIVRKDGKAVIVQGDVSKETDVKRIFEEATATFGPVDILMNNAGVFAFRSLDEVTEEEFHRQFNINVLGSLLMAREAAKRFGPDGGVIINTGSVITDNPMPGSSIYASTKGAIDSMTIALARELGPRKIRVNNLAPGGTKTEGTVTLGIMGGDFEKRMVEGTPLGRIGTPEDIARVAVFLASDDAAWISGTRLTASGGQR